LQTTAPSVLQVPVPPTVLFVPEPVGLGPTPDVGTEPDVPTAVPTDKAVVDETDPLPIAVENCDPVGNASETWLAFEESTALVEAIGALDEAVEAGPLAAPLVALPDAGCWVADACPIAAHPVPVGVMRAVLAKVVTYLPGLGISRLLDSWLPQSELGRLTLKRSSSLSKASVLLAPPETVTGAQFM